MLIRLRRLTVCFVLVVAVLSVCVMPGLWSGGEKTGEAPYGVIFVPGTDGIGTQDFAYNLNYLRQIELGTVAHPYRLLDQERIVRSWCPKMAGGLPHAYSPAALVVAQPLLLMTPAWAYTFFTLLNAVLLVLLTCLYLVPRMENSVQAGAVLASFFGFVLYDIFFMGQSSIVTTCLLGVGFVLLSDRTALAGSGSIPVFSGRNLILGAIAYILAAKPSVALILIAMLVAEGAWVPLLLSGAALAVTWLALAGHYGGLIDGLRDYSWLLNHFCLADMTPFMREGLIPNISTNFTAFLTTIDPAQSEPIFLASRILFEGLIVVLLVARWMKRISLETQFHGLLWVFLLFCPYLLVTEDFAVCLLAVGAFFRPGWSAPFKILLVFLLVNSCMGTWSTHPWFFPLKLALALWWLADLLVFQPRRKKVVT